MIINKNNGNRNTEVGFIEAPMKNNSIEISGLLVSSQNDARVRKQEIWSVCPHKQEIYQLKGDR